MDILRDMKRYFRGFEHIVPMLIDFRAMDHQKQDQLRCELSKMPGITVKIVSDLVEIARRKSDISNYLQNEPYFVSRRMEDILKVSVVRINDEYKFVNDTDELGSVELLYESPQRAFIEYLKTHRDIIRAGIYLYCQRIDRGLEYSDFKSITVNESHDSVEIVIDHYRKLTMTFGYNTDGLVTFCDGKTDDIHAKIMNFIIQELGLKSKIDNVVKNSFDTSPKLSEKESNLLDWILEERINLQSKIESLEIKNAADEAKIEERLNKIEKIRTKIRICELWSPSHEKR